MKNGVIFLILLTIFTGCKDEDSNPGNSSPANFSDADFYTMAKTTTGFTYFNNSTDKLTRAPGSGHTQPTLSTRYNAKAASQLDTLFKVKSSANFPDSSFVVKELYNADGTVAIYAFMYKLKNDPNADANGWIW